MDRPDSDNPCVRRAPEEARAYFARKRAAAGERGRRVAPALRAKLAALRAAKGEPDADA